MKLCGVTISRDILLLISSYLTDNRSFVYSCRYLRDLCVCNSAPSIYSSRIQIDDYLKNSFKLSQKIALDSLISHGKQKPIVEYIIRRGINTDPMKLDYVFNKDVLTGPYITKIYNATKLKDLPQKTLCELLQLYCIYGNSRLQNRIHLSITSPKYARQTGNEFKIHGNIDKFRASLYLYSQKPDFWIHRPKICKFLVDELGYSEHMVTTMLAKFVKKQHYIQVEEYIKYARPKKQDYKRGIVNDMLQTLFAIAYNEDLPFDLTHFSHDFRIHLVVGKASGLYHH